MTPQPIPPTACRAARGAPPLLAAILVIVPLFGAPAPVRAEGPPGHEGILVRAASGVGWSDISNDGAGVSGIEASVMWMWGGYIDPDFGLGVQVLFDHMSSPVATYGASGAEMDAQIFKLGLGLGMLRILGDNDAMITGVLAVAAHITAPDDILAEVETAPELISEFALGKDWQIGDDARFLGLEVFVRSQLVMSSTPMSGFGVGLRINVRY